MHHMANLAVDDDLNKPVSSSESDEDGSGEDSSASLNILLSALNNFLRSVELERLLAPSSSMFMMRPYCRNTFST